MELLKVDLVSPSGQLFSGVQTERLLAPSIDGQITLLPGHRDMMCLLGRGLLFLEGMDEKFVLYGGVLQITNGDNVTVAADRVTKASSLSSAKLDAIMKEIEQRINSETLGDKEYKELMDRYLDHIAELNSL